MIDGVRLEAAVAFPDQVAARLERARTLSAGDDSLSVVGYVGTLRASLRGDRLWLRGSLPEFVGSESVLGCAAVESTRRRIETHLGEDMGDARVIGLEITADLVLPRPCYMYLPLLRRLSRHSQRVTYEGTGVAFISRSRSLTWYDKGTERIKRRRQAPASHVLRVEVKLARRVQRQLKTSGPVTLAQLHDPEFHRFLVGWWAKQVASVERVRAPQSLPATGDVKRWLELAGLHAIGYDTVEAVIRDQQDAGILKRSTASDRRDWLRKLAADPALTVEDERVAELDAAIREATERALGLPQPRRQLAVES